MEFRGTGRKIYDGSRDRRPYLHGVVVREDFAEEYPEVVVAFIKAVYEAGDWIKQDPMRAAEHDGEVDRRREGGAVPLLLQGRLLTLDPTIKPAWVDALKLDHGVLAKEKLIPPLDFDALDHRELHPDAYKELGARLRSREGKDRRSGEGQPGPADAKSGMPATA